MKNSLAQYGIVDEKIEYENFKLIIKELSPEILESLEKIKYIPYLFFNKKTADVNLQKNCVEILFQSKNINNIKDLKRYIETCVPEEKAFYIVNAEFWNDWLNYIESSNKTQMTMNNSSINKSNFKEIKPKESDIQHNNNLPIRPEAEDPNKNYIIDFNRKDSNLEAPGNNSNNIKKQSERAERKENEAISYNSSYNVSNIEVNSKYSKSNKPCINTNKICDKNTKIWQSLQEGKDFIILDSKLFRLFKNWFRILGPELKRSFVINPSLKDKCNFYPENFYF